MSILVAKIIYYILHIMEFFIYLPQIIKLVKTKSSKDFSICSQFLFITMNIGYITYFILTGIDKFQLMASLLVFSEIIVQTSLIFIYRKNK